RPGVMPGATCRSKPHAPWAARRSRFGIFAVSSSDLPVSGRGKPPSPSDESRTILLSLETTSCLIRSSMGPRSICNWGARDVTPKRRGESPLVLCVLDRVLQDSQSGDFQAADVTRLQEHGRLHREADTG